MNLDMKYIFREKGEYIKLHLATEVTQDPYEKNVTFSEVTTVPVKAIVTDFVASQSMWKMPGIEVDKAKEIIIDKKHENTLKQTNKITIRNEQYLGWRINGQLQYRVEQEIIRAYVYIKKV